MVLRVLTEGEAKLTYLSAAHSCRRSVLKKNKKNSPFKGRLVKNRQTGELSLETPRPITLSHQHFHPANIKEPSSDKWVHRIVMTPPNTHTQTHTRTNADVTAIWGEISF